MTCFLIFLKEQNFPNLISNFILAQIWHKVKKPTLVSELKILFLLVRPEGFEPTTYGLEVRCSIQLSKINS